MIEIKSNNKAPEFGAALAKASCLLDAYDEVYEGPPPAQQRIVYVGQA